ncbi:MAG: 4Fe-4S dicluster domain-containing protein [Deltaproteobacteria bacterium]|nr:4Fe-4S dicluster domain-containing protein [Deltaproteobacteria bacterium]
MQLAFYFDPTRCTGCEACVVACKDWKDIPAGGARLLRIVPVEEGRFPNVGLHFHPLGCFHCAEPPCVEACPTRAIHKRPEDGVVVVEEELCLSGCRRCLEACPYQAPQFIGEGPARLCDFCLDRWEIAEKPICVLACPQRALDAGPLEELRSRHGGGTRVKGFPDPGQTMPSILFRSKKR